MNKNFTAIAYVTSRALCVPFWGLFYLLPIILYKDLGATPFQLMLLYTFKHSASLLSPYWSHRVHEIRSRLQSNLIWANTLKFSPFLFFPFIENSWFYIGAFGLHMALCRGTIPAWMEILKLNIPARSRGKVCALGSTIDFLGVALLPFLFGGILDNMTGYWKWLFPLAALLGILSSIPIQRIRLALPENDEKAQKKHHPLLSPWKTGFSLLKEKKDFSRFQLGFFFGGAGLMIIQPALPKYFVDTLQLSYSELLTAFAGLKGIGFALSSPLWVKSFNRSRLFSVCAMVTLCAATFPLMLMAAKSSPSIVFIAYLLYGIMEGGSELTWKMSGPLFSGDRNSAPYTTTNVLAVGVRGLIFPLLGSLLFTHTGSPPLVFLAGATLCLLGTLTMVRSRNPYPIKSPMS